ncbi:MAG: hypothetical protein JWM93_2433 [Frankiales bacterium]|nr:hypothetical protein [Frankiales bacterium]
MTPERVARDIVLFFIGVLGLLLAFAVLALAWRVAFAIGRWAS